jgi:hypothetical protein
MKKFLIRNGKNLDKHSGSATLVKAPSAVVRTKRSRFGKPNLCINILEEFLSGKKSLAD